MICFVESNEITENKIYNNIRKEVFLMEKKKILLSLGLILLVGGGVLFN